MRSLPPRRAPRGRTVFGSAEISRLTADFVTSILSADQELRGDLKLLRARARALSRDDPHAVQFIRLLKANVIGPKGIRLQARIRGQDAEAELDSPLNDAIEDAWDQWGEVGTCTIDGRYSWWDVQNLLIATLATDGEFLLRRRVVADPNRNAYGYALQFLDADLLDERYNTAPDMSGVRISMGVELDADNVPLAYHLWTRHPADAYEGARWERKRVPASEIIHGFVPFRIGQTRGVPWFAPVLLRLRMLDGYFEAETVAARLAAMKQGFITTTGPGADGFQEPIEGETSLSLDAEPGQLHELRPGQGFTHWDPQHPTMAFKDFTGAVLRAIAAGLGPSYMSLTGDLEATSFSSGRIGLLQERDNWQCLQQWMTEHVHTLVYRDWLKYAATTGMVRLPDLLQLPRWSRCQWMPRGFPWVDPLKDVQADAIALRVGLTTRTQLCAEQGLDFEEVLEQLAAEDALAKEYGVTLDTDYGKPVPGSQATDAGAGDPGATDNGGGEGRVLPLRSGRGAR